MVFGYTGADVGRPELALRVGQLASMAGSIHAVASQVGVKDQVISSLISHGRLPSVEVLLKIYQSYPRLFPELRILDNRNGER